MYCELNVTLLVNDCLIVLYYALFYSLKCHINKLFWLIGFFVVFFYIDNHAFCKTNSSEKTMDTRQKIFCATLCVNLF